MHQNLNVIWEIKITKKFEHQISGPFLFPPYVDDMFQAADCNLILYADDSLFRGDTEI